MPSRLLRFRSTAPVRTAFERGDPVVALESSVLAQGLLPPHNREAAERMTAAVLREGATPAITAVSRGELVLGLDDVDLERFLARPGVRKVSARDLAIAISQHADGATTVAATIALCVLAGIQVFATGGIGGVHRGTAFDESADLVELSRSQVIVVCAGAKSILDLPATLERLETLGVSVVGYGTLERPGAMLVVQPPPAEFALDEELVERATATALARAERENVRHSAVTPFLLAEVLRLTEGRSVQTNLALLDANAALAARIAVRLSSDQNSRSGV